MARVVVHAVVQATAQDVRLIVSVSGAEDGLPRSGLASTNFDVVSVASDEDTAPRQQLIAQVVEGPAGSYQLVLAIPVQSSTLVPRTSIFAIYVSGDRESGWADELCDDGASEATPIMLTIWATVSMIGRCRLKFTAMTPSVSKGLCSSHYQVPYTTGRVEERGKRHKAQLYPSGWHHSSSRPRRAKTLSRPVPRRAGLRGDRGFPTDTCGCPS
jgi:hypothetical protein